MKLLITLIALSSPLTSVHADETLTEKGEVKMNSVKRTVKKGLHRTREAACGNLTGDNKLECEAKKAKNHIEESKDAVKDKASEIKNVVD